MNINPLAVLKKIKDTVWQATERAVIGFHETFNHTEKIVPRYDDKGVLLYSDKLVDGKMVERIFYHANGGVAMRNPYENGVRHGLGIRYDQQHKPCSTCLVEQGEIIEVSTYRDGKLSGYVPYGSGKRNGLEKKYGTNERLEETLEWRDGVRQLKKTFAEDGSYSETLYLGGKPVEPVAWYTPEHILSREEYADRNIGYHANGRVSMTMPKQDGVRNGEVLYYTEQGDPKSSDMYKNDKRNGKSMIFYKDGSWTERMFRDDLPLDPVSIYDKDGKLTGRRSKECSVRFDDDGTELIIPYDDKGEYHGYEVNHDPKTGSEKRTGAYYLHGQYVVDHRFPPAHEISEENLEDPCLPPPDARKEFKDNAHGDLPKLPPAEVSKLTHYLLN